MKIVGLVGPKRSGKSTAAAALVEQGYTEIGFADSVKELALRIDPVMTGDINDPVRLGQVVDGVGWEHAKQLPEVRRFLQELGTGVRDIVGAYGWVDAWYRKMLKANMDGAAGVVVPDVRFLNEAKMLRDQADTWGGELLVTPVQTALIRITRPGLDTSDTHISETEQAGIECDLEIVNDGSPEDLRVNVRAAVEAFASS